MNKIRFFFVFLGFVSFFSCDKTEDPSGSTPITYTVSGTINKSDGGAASGASVMLAKSTDGSNAGQAPANAAGEYIITGVEAGSYKIVASLSGYETATVNDVKVTASNLSGIDVTLAKIAVATYTISGKVTKPDGSAATNALVQVWKTGDNTNVGQAATVDAQGNYSVADIPSGDYKIIVSLDGYETGILENVKVNNAALASQNIVLQVISISGDAISVIFSGASVSVSNLPADGSVTSTVSGADVTLSSSATKTLEYAVSGSTSNGSLKIQTPADIKLTLNSAVITSTSSLPPIQITKNEGTVTVELKGSSILKDASGNGENAVMITKKGAFKFEGYGKLEVSGSAKHAIASETTIHVAGGEITVSQAASDGFHSEGFSITAGTLKIGSTKGDGIDAGGQAAEIKGGNINISSTADDVKGIKGDKGVTISGGALAISVSGAQSKAISSKADIAVSAGEINITTSGATVLSALNSGYDPSYCTAIKSDGNVNISGGTIKIESKKTADGGKGISADGDVNITGGTLSITTAGDGKTYTASTGTPDSYTAACIKSDKNISLTGGTITCSSTGTGGKCIAADGTLTIGLSGANNADVLIHATTSGERFLVSGSSGGGGGMGGPGGGFGDNGTDYANPKAIKSEGNMTINSGTLYVNCTQKNEGGEGLESKATLTINGGNIDIRTYDDCINAATAIVINGGNLYCAASGQDAIDSNGTLTVNGGLTIANGVRGDGESFDSERNVTINGGIIVGTSGNTMSGFTGKQRSCKFQAACGSSVALKNSQGEYVLLFTVPIISGASTGTNVVVVFSDPRLTSGSYTLYSGGSISGGTTVNGYNTGGTYSGGTSKSVSL
ncbi:MAG: carbohydrate-binding domain-containing protein [Dysgonamonadaceae bacterium]|jgi:hypothetical protein|nr:carbohydrate-binding domain-containing protein [Dysgonamonadaceae bacterium]